MRSVDEGVRRGQAPLEQLRCGRPRCPCAGARIRHCPAHQDRRPSLTVDMVGDRLLVHCHAGCTQAEVIAALRARGLWPDPRSGQPRTDWPRTLGQLVLDEAVSQKWFSHVDAYATADAIRAAYRTVDRARQDATKLGDVEAAWEMLKRAADLEREVHALEASL
jgi:hypothetical protein